MNRYTILGLAAGLVLGVFIGYQAGSAVTHGAAPAPVAAMPSMPMPPMPPAPGGPVMPAPGTGAELQSRIAMNQSIVARDPKNLKAWIQLGNDFFDLNQAQQSAQMAQKSVEAYGRALELAPGDPDVLTDQGVMYRALGQFDKAIANFEKASRASPKHVQSLYNMGVVYAHDLKQAKKATDAWNRVIALAPESEQAALARKGIEDLKAGGGK